MFAKLPALLISGMSITVGVISKFSGVRLFSGIVEGRSVPNGETDIVGTITSITVPGSGVYMIDGLDGIAWTAIWNT